MFEIEIPDEILLMEHFRNVKGIIRIIEDIKSFDKEDTVKKENV